MENQTKFILSPTVLDGKQRAKTTLEEKRDKKKSYLSTIQSLMEIVNTETAKVIHNDQVNIDYMLTDADYFETDDKYKKVSRQEIIDTMRIIRKLTLKLEKIL